MIMLRRESRLCVKFALKLVSVIVSPRIHGILGSGTSWELEAASWIYSQQLELEAGPAAYFKMNLT